MPQVTESMEYATLRNCKLCRLSKVCNSLQGICILMQYATLPVLIGTLGYLFFTQQFPA